MQTRRLCPVIGIFLAFSGSLLKASAAAPADFYVSPQGNDAWSGHLAAPNREKTDGPFATLQRAQTACRALKASGKAGHGITVQLRGGNYFLKRTLEFTPEDSGTATIPIRYEAYPGETPVLSGGQPLTHWQKNAAGYLTTRLPEVANGKWNFTQLWSNGQRRMRPRLPKNGYYFIAGSLPPSPKAEGKGYDQFRFTPGDVSPAWSNLHDVEALCFQIWTMVRLPVDSVEATSNTIILQGDTHGLLAQSALPRGNRYLLENVKEALREPGEWYLDRPTGTITYIPLAGEKINDSTLIAPHLEQLLKITGTESAAVEHLTFRGLTFSHTNWVVPLGGYGVTQAEVNINAAIASTWARNCTFNHCRVEHIGNYAFDFATGCKNDRIENCLLRDMGAGGVKIGDGRTWDQEAAVASDNTVRDCVIESGGRIHPAAVGVWVGQSSRNRIEHNVIADFYYSGVSMGWSWGYNPTQAHNNHISDNRIVRIGQGVLSDMGGIYTLGLSPGSVLEGNVISDIQSHGYGGWGIYFDEGTTDLVARNNIVYNTKTGGFHQHYGKDNRVTNNIFAYSDENGQLIRTRAEDHKSFTIDHNIVLYRQANLLGSNWANRNFALDYNLYWNEVGKPVTFDGKTLEQWRQQEGQDAHSQIADPLFVAPHQGNFQLKPGSPAKQIGFVPIDASNVGPREDSHIRLLEPNTAALARSTVKDVEHPLAAAKRAFPAPPPVAPAMPFADGFEGMPTGSRAVDAVTNEENPSAGIRITEEAAHNGKRSLKFTDIAGQQFSYSPHMYYEPHYSEGMVECIFALRMEPGAVLVHEWRDGTSPYHAGPSLSVDGQGNLTANGKAITALPPGKWVEISIRCGVGTKANGKYDLSVRVPGKAEPVQINKISCDPSFRSLDWFGFISNGVQPSFFYLDDLKVNVSK